MADAGNPCVIAQPFGGDNGLQRPTHVSILFHGRLRRFSDRLCHVVCNAVARPVFFLRRLPRLTELLSVRREMTPIASCKVSVDRPVVVIDNDAARANLELEA